MRRSGLPRAGRVALLALGVVGLSACGWGDTPAPASSTPGSAPAPLAGARAQGAADPAPALEGLWQAGDTVMRLTVEKAMVRGTMAEVGAAARTLGFEPGDASFVASADGHYLWGEQVIRYAGPCHPSGRKISMMARMTPDGRVLAVHHYTRPIDQGCRDTGEYEISQVLWQRVPAR